MRVRQKIIEKVLNDPLLFGKPQDARQALKQMRGELARPRDGETREKPKLAVDARTSTQWQTRTLNKAFRSVQNYPDRPPVKADDSPLGHRE